MSPRTDRERPAFFYGWIVLAVATFAMSLTVVGNGIGLAVFLDPILRDLDVSRSAAAALFTVATLASAATLPFIGSVLDRHGARVTLVIVAIGFGGACVLMGIVDGLASLAVGLVALRVLGLGAINLVGVHAINQWFVARRGLAIGVAGVTIGLLMGVLPALLDVAVRHVGWRGTYLGSALVMVAVLAPAAWLWMRSTPEQLGLTPDGDALQPARPSMRASAARRTRMLWTLVTTDVLVAIFLSGLVFHHYDVAVGQGIPRTAAASMFLPFGIASALSILGIGIALRRVSPRPVMTLMLVATAGALALSLRLEATLLPLYGLCVGLAQGSKDAVQANAFAHYFGRRELGAIAGIGAGFSLAGAAIGPALFAIVRESAGSYAGIASFGAALAVGAIGLVITTPDPQSDRQDDRLGEV